MKGVVATLRSAVTYRRWACLVVGGALLMPYMMAGGLVAAIWRPSPVVGDPLLSVEPLVFLAVLPIIAVSGLFLPVRAFEIAAARALLGVSIEPPPPVARRTWTERLRTAAWFTAHLAFGGIASGLALALVPFAIWTTALPLMDRPISIGDLTVETGWAAAWGPPLAVLTLVSLFGALVGAGSLLAALAPALLGPSPADRLATAEANARRLAARNRLARELHDSVGHALSVVTVQAAAAGRVLDRDPATARAALDAIEQSARSALAELDHVIGVLREGASRTDPEPTLHDLDRLLDSSGARITRNIGDLSGVPPVVSREAYRIVQEALTNALRYGTGPVEVTISVRDENLELDLRNATRARRDAHASGRRAGRGLAGMRERADLLGGEFEAGPADGGWRVRASLPLPIEGRWRS
ncbi:histidine kinase [Microtetraspora sp. NBRC 16547]|uniref:sensor histidine kinase n=1 Tax=Microtetraspora sp. NBRC 16547 TaxID=3030993 RepID=UPI0024A43805|nr:histidine kinase [Microtetraspora sp. NBRC 16547]GLW98647.1 histidine kinase [Microtetraspora sp. NBRC 16547]